MKSVSILGSTGSIGVNTLNVIRLHAGRFKVVALAAGSNLNLVAAQVKEFGPRFVSVEREEDALRLSNMIGSGVEVGFGVEGAEQAAVFDGPDVTVSAITGAAGLAPTLAAVRAGGVVALANKESLVLAGAIVMAEAARSGAVIIPVDSEHSAIMQSLVGHRRCAVACRRACRLGRRVCRRALAPACVICAHGLLFLFANVFETRGRGRA